MSDKQPQLISIRVQRGPRIAKVKGMLASVILILLIASQSWTQTVRGLETISQPTLKSQINTEALKKIQEKRQTPAFSIKFAAQAKGPGRSGGGNGTMASPSLLDTKESKENTPIQDWNGVPAYVKLTEHLQSFPSLKEYLTEAFKSKNWLWTFREIPTQGCLNATLNGTSDGNYVLACQWQLRGLILKPAFDEYSLETQVQLLIHEGLVHHMVSNLNRMERIASQAFVDQTQESMELAIHNLSEKILNLQFKDIYEINDDLRKMGFPLILTAQEAEKLNSQFAGKKAIDVFVGAAEKTQLMRRHFDSGTTIDMESWGKKLGSQACFFSADGYSAPGFYAGGFIKFDEMFPTALFTVYAFKDIDLPEEQIRQGMQQTYTQPGLHVPLSFDGQDWNGTLTIDVRKKFEEVFKQIQDPKQIEEIKDLLKKQLGQNSLDLHQVIKLTIRAVKTPNPNSNYIIMRREVVSQNKPQDISIDYISGNLQPYPSCLKLRQ